MKKVKVQFPDGSVAELSEVDAKQAIAGGAKLYSEKTIDVKFPDGSLASLSEDESKLALTGGATLVKKKEDVQNGSVGSSKTQAPTNNDELLEIPALTTSDGVITDYSKIVPGKKYKGNNGEVYTTDNKGVLTNSDRTKIYKKYEVSDQLGNTVLGGAFKGIMPVKGPEPEAFKGRNVKGQFLANFTNNPAWHKPTVVSDVNEEPNPLANSNNPFTFIPTGATFSTSMLDSQELQEFEARKNSVPVPQLPNKDTESQLVKSIIESRNNDAIMRQRAKEYLIKDATSNATTDNLDLNADNFPAVDEYFNNEKTKTVEEIQALRADLDELGMVAGDLGDPKIVQKLQRINQLDTRLKELKRYANVFIKEQAAKQIKREDFAEYSDYLKAMGRKVNSINDYNGVKKKEEAILKGDEDSRNKIVRQTEDYNYELAGILALQSNIVNDFTTHKIDEQTARQRLSELNSNNNTLESRYPEVAIDNIRKYVGDYIAQKRKEKDGNIAQAWHNVVSAAPSQNEIDQAIHDIRANDQVEISEEQAKAIISKPDKIPLTSMLGHFYKSTIVKGAETINNIFGTGDNEARRLDFRDPSLYQPIQLSEIALPTPIGDKNVIRMQPNPNAGKHADILSWATANSVSDVAGTIASYMGLNKAFGAVAQKLLGGIAGAETVGYAATATGELKPITALTEAQVNLASNIMSSTYLNYYDKLDAAKELTNDKTKQMAYALSSSLITGLVFSEINPGKILSGVSGAEEKGMGEKFIQKLIDGNGKLEPEKFKSFFANWATETAKDLGHNLSLVKANQIADIALDRLTNKDALENRDVMDEMFGSLPSDIISFLPFSAVAGYQKASANIGVRNAVRMAIMDPVKFEAGVLENVSKGKISEQDAQQKINYIKGLANVYRGKDLNTEKLLSLSTEDRYAYANNLLQENRIKKGIEGMTDVLQIGEENKKIETLQAERQKILSNANQENKLPVSATEGQIPETSVATNQPQTQTDQNAKIQAAETVVKKVKEQPPLEVVDVPISTVIGGVGKYKGINGNFEQEGQRVIFHEENGIRSHDIGNINEIKDQKTSELGIEYTPSKVEINNDGNITVDGELYVPSKEENPLSTVKKDNDGNVLSIVVRKEQSGEKKMFKGAIAEDIAYQLHLKEITKDNETANQFEQFINSEEIAPVIHEGLSEVAKAEADNNNGKVSGAQGKKLELTTEQQSVIDNADGIKNPTYKALAKEATDAKEIDEILKDVSDQWHDDKTRGVAERDFPKPIIDAAIKMFPQEKNVGLELPSTDTGVIDVTGKGETQKELEGKVDVIKSKIKELRDADGSIPDSKRAEFNGLMKELAEAKSNARRGNSTSSILIKRIDKNSPNPVHLTKEEKKDAADLIEQVIQSSKTVEEVVKKVGRLGYVFDIANADFFAAYVKDRLSDAPPVGNNKSSFQDWVNGKQPPTGKGEKIGGVKITESKDGFDTYESDNGNTHSIIDKTNPNEWKVDIIESKKTGNGDGSRVMQKIIDDAKENGVKKITLSSSTPSGDALYNKFGFEKLDKNVEREGGEYLEIPMELNLETKPTQPIGSSGVEGYNPNERPHPDILSENEVMKELEENPDIVTPILEGDYPIDFFADINGKTGKPEFHVQVGRADPNTFESYKKALDFFDEVIDGYDTTKSDLPEAESLDHPGKEPEKIFPAPINRVNYTIELKAKDYIPQEEATSRVEKWKNFAKEVGEKEDHSKEVVISIFDASGTWSKPYEEAGYTVIRYDLSRGDDVMRENWAELRGRIEAAGKKVIGVITAPPCTSFAVSGARWWGAQHDNVSEEWVQKKYGTFASRYFDRPLDYAVALVDQVKLAVEFLNPSLFHVAENPVGRIQEQADLPKPTLVFNPNNFGDPYTKKTQIWGEMNPNLPHANVDPIEGSKMHKLRGDNPDSKKERSQTPEGFGYSFFVANNTSKLKLDTKSEPSKVDVKKQEEEIIQKWLNDEYENLDGADIEDGHVSFDWDGKILEIFQGRNKPPLEFTKEELIDKGVDFSKTKQPNEQQSDTKTGKSLQKDASKPEEQGNKKSVPESATSTGQGNAEAGSTVLAKPISEKVKSKFNKLKNKENEPIISSDGAENKLAVAKLTTEDNPIQEPSVKAIESKAKSNDKAKLNEVVKEASELINTATGVVNVPIADISTNPKEYQGRKNKFSERSANKVHQSFDPNKLDPIIVYKHPDGKTYVLSGHSRLEGMKRRNEETIPARYFEGTPEAAKEFAQTSNKLGDLQTDIENAAYYRSKLKDGESYNAILTEAKENEPEGTAKKIVSLAHLNPEGKAMQALDALQKGEGDTKNNVLNIAAKIGDIRAKNDHLTDAHENELFDYMVENKNNIPTDKDLLNQNNTLNRSINSAKFSPDEPLNLERVVVKSENRIQWEKEKAELEQQQSELKKQVNPSKITGWTGLKEKAIATLAKGDKSPEAIDKAAADFEKNKDGIKDAYQKQLDQKKAELNAVSDKLAKHLLREKDLIEGDKAQQSLFAVSEPSAQQVSDMKEIVKQIQNEYAAKDENITLDDIKAIAKRELGSDYNEQLVEDAYHEAGKENKAFKKATAIRNELAKRVQEFTGNETIVLPNSDALLEKANELGDVSYQNYVRNYVKAAITSIMMASSHEAKAPVIETKINKEISVDADRKTKNTISNLVESYFSINDETAPQEVVDRAIRLWEAFGKPEILPDSTGKDERAYANSDEIGNITNFDDFVAELSHSVQFKSEATLDDKYYATQAERDKFEYARKGSTEYDAHKLIEPMIADYILNGTSSMDFAKTEEQKKIVEKYNIRPVFQVQGKMVMPLPEVTNGFYSPLEKIINEFKGDKLPAKQWADKFKGEEAKWTGLTDWLNSKTGSVSKAEIQQFLKENRIEVVEVVKGGEVVLGKTSKERMEDIKTIFRNKGYRIGFDMSGEVEVSDKEGRTMLHELNEEDRKDPDLADFNDLPDELKTLSQEFYDLNENGDASDNGNTQYAGYQLPGEKSNYKEVLITMPNELKERQLTQEQKDASRWYDIEKRLKEINLELIKGENADLKKEGLSLLAEKDDLTQKYKGQPQFGKLPQKELFKSSHFSEPNILAHVRMNTRIDSEGKKVLFLEEIQSDWGETGRKQGFAQPVIVTKEHIAAQKIVSDLQHKLIEAINIEGVPKSFEDANEVLETLSNSEGEAPIKFKSNSKIQKLLTEFLAAEKIAAEYNSATSNEQFREGKKPNPAPFVTDTNAWTKLALKVALKEAVKEGADKIAWTTGEQQADRYDLSKQVDEIRVNDSKPYKVKQNPDNYFKEIEVFHKNNSVSSFDIGRDGRVVEGPSTMYNKPLSEVVGKEMAEKIMNSTGFKQFTGLDLKVGGKGMEAFYGDPSTAKLGIVGNVAKSLFKQEPKTTKIPIKEGEGNLLGNKVFFQVDDTDIKDPRKDIQFGEPLKESEAVQYWVDLGVPRKEVEKALADAKGVDAYSTQHSIDITSELKSQVEQGQPLFMKGKDGKILGFTHDGKIYLNGEHLNPNTPIHEAGHIWVEVAKEKMPAVYKRGIELINGSNYLKKAMANEFYQQEAQKLPRSERKAYFEHEALAAAIGDKGAQFITEARRKSFIDWATDLWNKIASIAGFKNVTAKELQDMTLEDFAKRAAGDILKGKEAPIEEAAPEPDIVKKEPGTATTGEPVHVSHAGMQDIADDFGLSDVQSREHQSDAQDQENAATTAKQWHDEGTYAKNIDRLLSNIEEGKGSNPVDKAILQQHIANVREEAANVKNIYSKEYDDKINELERLKKAGALLKSTAGATLRDSTLFSEANPTMADWMADRKEVLEVDELTPGQKEEVQKIWDEYEAKLKVADEKVAAAEQEIERLKAELAVRDTKGKRTYLRSKNREQLKVERENIIKNIQDKLKKARGETNVIGVPYAKELFAIAPDVSKLVTNLIDTGISKLADIVDNVHEVLKDAIPGITKRDVMHIIAGEYNQDKPTLTQLQLAKKDVVDEAKLIRKLEMLQNGEPLPERQARQRNKEITDLRAKIKEYRKYDQSKRSPEQILNAIKRANEKRKEEIEKRIANKDFSPPTKKVLFHENQALKRTNPQLYKETMDAILEKEEAGHKFELLKKKDELGKRGVIKKFVVDPIGKTITTLKAIKAGIDDSVTMVQLMMAVYSNPRSGLKAKVEAFKDINNTRFKRELAALHNSVLWPVIQGSGLDITEPQSFGKKEVEELYSGNLLDDNFKIPLTGGKKVNPWTYTGGIFERIFTSMGNNLRLNLFYKRVEMLEQQGKTFESHPEEYKGAARAINELTARGKVPQKLQSSMEYISPIIWAPKMLASTLNTLGITDLVGFATGKKGVYRSIPPQQARYLALQMSKGIGMGVSIMLALAYKGWGINFDPRSNFFGNVTTPDGKRTYNVFGRFGSLVKTLVQLGGGERIEQSGKETDIDKSSGARGKVLWKFVRGKMTPAAGLFSDYWLNNKTNTFTKQPITLNSLPSDLIKPIFVSGLQQGLQNDGVFGILNRALPELEGIQVTDQRDYKTVPSSLSEKTSKYLKDHNANEPYFNPRQIEVKQMKNGKGEIKKLSDLDEETQQKYEKTHTRIFEQELNTVKSSFVFKDAYGNISLNSDDANDKKVWVKNLDGKDMQKLVTIVNAKATTKTKESLFPEYKK